MVLFGRCKYLEKIILEDHKQFAFLKSFWNINFFLWKWSFHFLPKPSKNPPIIFLSHLNYPSSHSHLLGQYPTLFHLTKIFLQYLLNFKVEIYFIHDFFGLQRNHILYKSSASTKISPTTRQYPKPISPKTLGSTIQNFQLSFSSILEHKQSL